MRDMAGVLSYALLAGLSLLAARASGQQTCTVGGDPCHCTLSDGRYIDLNAISTAFTTPFEGINHEYQYVFGPCGGSLDLGDECIPSNQVAVCQQAGTWYNLGQSSQVTVIVDTNANPVTSTWTYTGGSDARETHVVVQCQQGSSPGSITDGGESPTLNYNLKVVSDVGCIKGGGGQPTDTPPPGTQPVTSNGGGGGGGGGGTSGKTGGISPGSVTVIIFFVVVTSYLVGGVLLMHFHRGAQGLEMIPNRSLWVEVPGLIKEGVLFVVSPCRGGRGADYEKL
ncbi:uncharacterized protein LOC135808685 [Sycon ciliatum]|uniref:uncharacterized protein LOC135808685 n=1 Tax=Sycon ciliatum TaxID=27933 RepID=UPI0031F6963C|eukprot:scpid89140/ scgid26057/ 